MFLFCLSATGKPFDIVKIQGLLNKTESITQPNVNLTVTGRKTSSWVNCKDIKYPCRH